MTTNTIPTHSLPAAAKRLHTLDLGDYAAVVTTTASPGAATFAVAIIDPLRGTIYAEATLGYRFADDRRVWQPAGEAVEFPTAYLALDYLLGEGQGEPGDEDLDRIAEHCEEATR